MHLQENTLSKVKVRQNVSQFPLHHVTYVPAKFEVSTSNSLRRNVFSRKYVFFTFGIDLGVKATQNIAQYPLHHEIYASAKFEVGGSIGVGEGLHILTRKVELFVDREIL